MVQPFLVSRVQRSSGGGGIAVFKEIDMQLVQIGADFGSNELSSAGGTYWPRHNRVVHWENDLYTVNINNIYKWDVAAGGPWTSVKALTGGDSLGHKRLGPTPCSIDGSGVLVFAHGTTNADVRVFRITKLLQDGTFVDGPEVTNDQSSVIGLFTTGGAGLSTFNFCSPISYRNSLIWVDGSTGAAPTSPQGTKPITVYDLKTDTLQAPLATPAQTVLYQQTQLCVHKDKVFALFTGSSLGAGCRLYRIDGATLQEVGILHSGNVTNTVGSTIGLFSFGGKLYAMFIRGTAGSNAWALFEITIDDETKNITSSVDVTSKLPSALTANQYRERDGVTFRVDNLSGDGIAPVVEMLVGDQQEGSAVSLYRWQNAPTGDFVFVDAGLDGWRFTRPTTVNGSSDRVWSGSGTINASQPVLNIDGANITAKFKIWGASQTGVKAQVIFNTESDPIMTVGTIAATDVGTVVGGDTVEGLVADGVTEVTVDWAAALDGVATGDNPRVAIRVFI